jgi:hypothetical protein
MTGRERALARMRGKKQMGRAVELMCMPGSALAKADAKNRLRGPLEQFKRNWYGGRGRLTGNTVRSNARDLQALILRLEDSYRRGGLSEAKLRGTMDKLHALCPALDYSWVERMVERRRVAGTLLRRTRDVCEQAQCRALCCRAATRIRANWAADRLVEQGMRGPDATVLGDISNTDEETHGRLVTGGRTTELETERGQGWAGGITGPCLRRTKAQRIKRKGQRIQKYDKMIGARRAPSAPIEWTANRDRDEDRELWLKQQLQREQTAKEKWEHFLKTGVE